MYQKINYLRWQVWLDAIESIIEVNKLDLSDDCNANTLYVKVNKSCH